jgi:hypothetical protein
MAIVRTDWMARHMQSKRHLKQPCQSEETNCIPAGPNCRISLDQDCRHYEKVKLRLIEAKCVGHHLGSFSLNEGSAKA